MTPPSVDPRRSSPAAAVLAVNAGSSSIRAALYRIPKRRPECAAEPLACLLDARIERIGDGHTTLHTQDHQTHLREAQPIAGSGHAAAAQGLIDWLATQPAFDAVAAIGHRVVHGMNHGEPERVSTALLAELHGIEPVDPDHLPAELHLIEAFRAHDPACVQVACFDTAFHHTLPRVARLMAIPRRYEAQGVRRYGFHGLSYAYLMEELARCAGVPAAAGRVVLAHLGSGASLAAVHGGLSMDTTMGFTPAAGLPMGTRSGDLDPGLGPYLNRTQQMSPAAYDDMVNHASGLLGVSETSADMRDLLALEATDVRAAEAIALFCYQAKKGIGAYAAALGGLDTLVFAGGIGEHAPPVRARICEGLGFLGITLDATRNAADAAVISTDASRVTVHVIATDEALMIARAVARVVGLGDAASPSLRPSSRSPLRPSLHPSPTPSLRGNPDAP